MKFLIFLFLIFAVDKGVGNFVVNVVTDGSYSITVNGNIWLTSGYTFFNNNGKKYSTADYSLKLSRSWSTSGRDIIGEWQSTNFDYLAASLPVTTTIKTYNDPDIPIAIFTQKYYGQANRTSANDTTQVISSFPSFQALSNGGMGFLAYGGDMAGYSDLKFGWWQYGASLSTGISGGPLVIFDSASNAMVISPLSQFMAASSQFSQQYQQLSYGIMGLVDTVPQNYSIDFIVYYSDKGINQAMIEWGKLLKRVYRRNQNRRNYGTTLNFMGYWTDNGAYYYYNTESGKNYETTILDAVSYIKSQTIPFKYTQYDSWWYEKGHKSGVLTWTPMPEVFPHGFKYLSDQTKLPFSCHNRFWDGATPYAKYNGGRYNFIEDLNSGLAVPDDDQFWVDLFNMTQQWGPFIMYEQDWLDVETDKNRVLQSDLFIGRRWLVGMGKAAEQFDIGIQYCMSYSRHILQSLEIPTVSQARVSGDYSPGGKQWNIGVTSMFVDALGVAPFKDTFWTTEVQPGSPYGNKTEPQTRLNSLIATLSTGPVGPGDGIGFINTTVLMRCCDSEGRILQPSKPAKAIDDQIKRSAFPTYAGPDGEVYSTYSNISGYIFGIVVAADLKNSYNLTPSSGWTFGQMPESVIYSGDDPTDLPRPFSEASPLRLGPECTPVNFCLYYTTPILQLGVRTRVMLLGEPNKWVPISQKRYNSIVQTSSDVIINLIVNAFEIVTFRFLLDLGPIQTIVCDNSRGVGPAIYSTISISQRTCVVF
ncbi:uncharacterized protein LOC106071759 isoform X1 [Biomphalaria glabrata]|uniref:Uncharacterized protein LOC106071759 isoform X1 n=2 Tax=Biomphalaria glabrata TaxID=6526 RepID=A0A9W3BHZ2_BIOGL|nr:uncharacterized protein LOC106071759 isoform X1 [Biomphalaria glabrata]